MTNQTKISDIASYSLKIGLFYSTLILISWIVGWDDLITLFSETATMKFNTALCFILSGFAILYSRNKRLSNILTAVSVILCLFTFLEYYSGRFFIDNLFIHHKYQVGDIGPMSQFTVINFLCLNLGFLLKNNSSGIARILAQVFYFIVFTIALSVIISFILNVPLGTKISMLSTLSLETSVIFLVYSSVLFVYSENEGLAQVFLSKYKGSIFFRKIVFPIVFIPVVLSGIFLQGVNVYHVTIGEILVLYTVVISVIGLMTSMLIAFLLNKSSRRNKELSKEVYASTQQLMTYKLAMDKTLMLIEVEKDGGIVYVNSLFEDRFGFSIDECKGKLLRNLIRSDDDDISNYDGFWEKINSDKIWENEKINKAKNGDEIWTKNYIVPFFNNSQDVERYLIIKQDITERKTEEILKQKDYIKKLELKNKELEQFTFIASHDLQEPLRTVTGLVEMLKDKYSSNLDDRALKAMGYLSQSTLRMKSLITALLDYSRIGKEAKLYKVNLNDSLAELLTDLDLLISESNAEITVGDLPELYAFRTNILLLFQNLIVNSIKFKNKDVNPKIEISALKKGTDWEFSVQDNGIGIKPEYNERIFTIFQRLHLRDEYKGNGIGLSHCRKIVHMHGGKIWLENNGKPGSCFKFTISTLIHLYEKEDK